ncbi:UDP-N-acetyl-D-mannosamine dehydrogenase [Maribellus maritimus]|uniref:UDP-N-acetyl-D-mannosamine dehydrogenase n=1 Tax=Maribellus maritimus TaxID=2870838 RepID=UPI001EEB9BBA|nr:UDP-N-acetyl-D-mannosamine dehydrogenase [Maribellus maritimus]MCG6188141.1 UDP-N-acetyl-D-mannosamine dehydrogenase [Maribellus maritimus]
MDKKFQKAVMMGLGYIGLPTAALMAKKDIRVIGVDVNKDVVDTINRGEIHIVEPELDGLVKYVIDKELLTASTHPSEANVFLIAVPTPFKDNHIPDISFVESATKMVIPFLREDNLFIIESTSPIFTTEKMAELIYSERPELKDKIYIAYCPERVLPGNVIYELENNDRVIGGIDEKSTEAAISFYQQFVKAPLHPTNSRTAEMCKLVENSSRDVNIAFANELSIICDKAQINVWDLIKLANKHPRVNILQPGTGVGGHCIAVDPWFIVSDFEKEAKIIRTAREINNYKTQWVIEKLKVTILQFQKENNRLPKIALMGLAFKPNIDDLRESPAKFVVQQMLSFGEAEYLIVEPNLKKSIELELTGYMDAWEQADIIVYLVAHREFLMLKYKPGELDFCGVRK